MKKIPVTPGLQKRTVPHYLLAGIRYLENGEREEPSPVVNQRKKTYPYPPEPSHVKEGWGNLALLKGTDLFHWGYVGHLLYPAA